MLPKCKLNAELGAKALFKVQRCDHWTGDVSPKSPLPDIEAPLLRLLDPR